MSTRDRRATPSAPAAPATPPPPRRRAPAPLALALLALALVGVAWLAWHGATRSRGAALPSVAGLSDAQLADSLETFLRARDWARELAWARAVNATRTPTCFSLLDEGMAWHNVAEGGSERWAGRTPTRTSLERIALERRAAALFDSAYARAGSEAERALVDHMRGKRYEVLGLPLDAMGAYAQAYARDPRDESLHARLVWMIHSFVRPADPRSVTLDDVKPRPR